MRIELDKYKNIERTQARYARDARENIEEIVCNLITYQEKMKREVWGGDDPEKAASLYWDNASLEDMDAIDDLVITLKRWRSARIMIHQAMESLLTAEYILLGDKEGGSHD